MWLADSSAVPIVISRTNAKPRQQLQLQLLATRAVGGEVLSPLDFIFWQEGWQLTKHSTEQLKQLQTMGGTGGRGLG